MFKNFKSAPFPPMKFPKFYLENTQKNVENLDKNQKMNSKIKK